MTDEQGDPPDRDPDDGPAAGPDADVDPAPAPARPGLNLFTIEGRAAPGLFVVGWLASILGLAILIVGALAGSALFVYFVGPLLLSVGLISGCGSQAIERRARGDGYAGPSPYLVFAATVAVTYAVAYPFGSILSFVLGSARPPSYVIQLIGVALQAAVFIGVVRLTVVGTGALSWREMGWRRFNGDALRDLGIGLLFALPVVWVSGIVGQILFSIFQTAPENPLPPTGIPAGTIVQLIAGAVIAPISEETVFRGFAITAWRRTVGDNGALIRASLLFALAHVIDVSGGSVPQVAGLIVVGFATRLPVAFALGWLFLRRGTIWAPLGLHMGFNGLILLAGELASRVAGGG
jgi:membrane protease YdiL (CAAX protease family)